uniref:DNA-directed DNA polymerase n=1 Tax=Globodera pallida TaxID=36090 RepID=A0A183CKZ0_GLOPA
MLGVGYCFRFADEKKCAHNEEERALLGTFTSIELRKALELGYKVTHFYRAYHFEEFDSQLFKGYVRMFLKIKVEASGWPPEVNSEEEKKAFVEMYKSRPKRDGRVISQDVPKNYEPVQQKGIIDNNLNVLPFGYFE